MLLKIVFLCPTLIKLHVNFETVELFNCVNFYSLTESAELIWSFTGLI